ncbi:molybdenum ABC transporter ATP-binding protein [Rhizobium sp. TRM95111]|uniref:molybdenum ABC transporter ATP-binding protein n=1 Tax=Rhizobium alarense TaxID=2846851 RepID=UPI001F180439|nr:molybdenum ABC transporter ATP-binding protein [Rhizobium alarense]MCF3640648.1 molybdenum ABC transporter ATP-binding protein [Rhizobium alarense]
MKDLSVSIRHRQGAFALAVDIRAGAGLTALFGPSGSGKTTVINAVAGLLRPTGGSIRFGDTVWFDATRGTFVPPHRRRIGYVFQEPRLFPHMGVRQNLLYGRRFLPGDARAVAFDDVVSMLGIAHLLDRRPSGLSGGEKSRVAIGRTLLSAPELLLMDEPLASLDAARKQEIMPYIERVRDETGVPVLYVSHAVGEVARLATSVVLMEEGRVRASGSPSELLTLRTAGGAWRPGAFIDAVIEQHRPEHGLTLARARCGLLHLRTVALAEGSRVRLHIPAGEVMLARHRPEAISALNILPGTVVELSGGEGPDLVATIDCGDRIVAQITRHSAGQLGLAPGTPVHVLFKAVSLDEAELFRQEA